MGARDDLSSGAITDSLLENIEGHPDQSKRELLCCREIIRRALQTAYKKHSSWLPYVSVGPGSDGLCRPMLWA